MPILGLTDRGAQLPRLGILRKGAPKPNEKQPGRDLGDHFRFETDDKAALADFTRAYGDKPNGIRVMFYYPTTAQNFETWQEHHSAGALKHRCDGRTCVLWLDQDGRYQHEPIPCPSIELKRQNPQIDKKHLCRPVGRLKIVIPELQRMAYVLVPTTSINDILELQSNLEAAEALRGDLRGIPFILSRRPRKVSTPGDNGQRARREKWLLSVEPAPDWVRLQLTAMERAALPQVDTKLLPAPAADPETGEIFEDEPDEDCEALRAELKRARAALYEAGGEPWKLTQRQVQAMTCAELRTEIDATWQTLQTMREAASAAEDWPAEEERAEERSRELAQIADDLYGPAADMEAEYDAIEAAEAVAK